MRRNYSSGGKWEDVVGYSRAVKIGNTIEIAGTTATDKHGTVIGVGDAYTQTKLIIEKAQAILKIAGAELDDVVRTRMFVTNISLWEQYARAHGEFFKEIKPAATMVEIAKLIHPDMLVEIEFTALIE